MTQKELARKGIISRETRLVAVREHISPEELAKKVGQGSVIILKNPNGKPIGIGAGLSIKINANIGTSTDFCNLSAELKKLTTAVKFGADTIMDLSTAGPLDKIRKKIVSTSPVPVGTVPVYQAVIESTRQEKALIKMKADKLFEVIEKNAEDKVSFVTAHCGVTLQVIEKLKKHPRVTDVVSRGGAFLLTWMMANNKENPLYEQFDRLLEIARRYDLILSLGDGLRPGSLADATDASQIEELSVLGELTRRAWEQDVQIMVEGPGHLPLNEIEANILLEKKICSGAPFYVLGPLVTDIAPGYDHITSAIGPAPA